MDLIFNLKLSENYKSNSQIARVLSEDWVLRNSYCPSCGNRDLNIYNRNNPAADFYCEKCKSDYELKSFRTIPKEKIVDGAYNSMVNKIVLNKNPNFFFLHYSPTYSVGVLQSIYSSDQKIQFDILDFDNEELNSNEKEEELLEFKAKGLLAVY